MVEKNDKTNMFGTRKTKARKIKYDWYIHIVHMTDTEYATKRVQWIQNHIFREHIGKIMHVYWKNSF